jgi:hypothetical protein
MEVNTMRYSSRIFALTTLSLLTVALWLFLASMSQNTAFSSQPASISPASQSSETSAAKTDNESSIIVAKIDDYVITKKELLARLMTELYPYESADYEEQAKPADANSALMQMLAEKAMTIEGRKAGNLNEEIINTAVRRYEDKRLANKQFQNYLKDKINITDAEIQQKLKDNPKLDREQVEAELSNAKANSLLTQYYAEIYKKSNVKKLTENYPKAITLYQKLLAGAEKIGNMAVIQNEDIKNKLTIDEKNMALATFDSGKVTLKDWFDTLNEISPPSRPKDLNTEQGVDHLLDRAISLSLVVAQAKLQGLDKDKEMVELFRDYEDRVLLSSVQMAKYEQIKEPTSKQMAAYYNKNKETFRTGRSLKIDTIWCQDLPAARKVRAELDAGSDFDAVKQKYSSDKQVEASEAYPGSEGLFWKDLWQAKVGEIVGPTKGFYSGSIKWRIVKILAKNPGEVKDYSSQMDNLIKNRMMSQEMDASIEKYGRELLKKYPPVIYRDTIKDIDPLNIP